MENFTRDVRRYIDNEMRLLEIKAENDVLLQRINRLETKINRAKQLLQQPNLQHVKTLNTMVTKSLHLLAEKDTISIVGNSLITERVLHQMIETRMRYSKHKFQSRLFYKQMQRHQQRRQQQRLRHFNVNIVQ